MCAEPWASHSPLAQALHSPRNVSRPVRQIPWIPSLASSWASRFANRGTHAAMQQRLVLRAFSVFRAIGGRTAAVASKPAVNVKAGLIAE